MKIEEGKRPPVATAVSTAIKCGHSIYVLMNSRMGARNCLLFFGLSCCRLSVYANFHIAVKEKNIAMP